MDINTLRGLSTVFVMIAFLGVCWWAYSPKRKSQFDDAAQLPFADDPEQSDDESSASSIEKERQNTL
jgi:cytochrome c oxidase cbb3-type subunit 4